MPCIARLPLVVACAALAGRRAVAETVAETARVNCGGHYAETCEVCAQDNEDLWCNGECVWYGGGCHEPNLFYKLKIWIMWSFWMWLYFIPHTALIGLVMAVYAAVYKKKIVEEIPMIPENDPDADDLVDREVKLFDCLKMPDQLIWAIFCSPVVVGKNYAKGQVLGFWPSCCLVYCGLYSLFWPVFLCMALVRTILSSKLKRNMGLKSNPLDCCVNVFCWPCEVGRESIEVNDFIGVKIRCPFEVEKSLAAKIELVEEAVDRTCRKCW